MCLGEVISYTEFGGVTSPDTIAVKVESKTHVYLVLNYTDEDNPKLETVEEVSLFIHSKNKQDDLFHCFCKRINARVGMPLLQLA